MKKKLLINGNVFKRTDGHWGGTIWYADAQGERKRKSFSGTTKREVSKKIKDYIAAFEDTNSASHESKKRLRESMQKLLQQRETGISTGVILHPHAEHRLTHR